ncbi:PREDICTED: vomeronasal type-1 receptor 4-like [Galeopterus variegatus]|uniref:Vomeronasal type-1 receptor n=1 Tax=Galeopterus variegatus TaxID=482537 RepID=A0ABM0RKA6_GALVR|nr:PREDICTED: vomeronasal type-1 receptor 4-like [Galeopterus variegatus]
MATSDLGIGMIFLLQTIAGILGNFFLLYHYLFLYFTEWKLRSIDLILMHLTIANCLVILSRGISQMMASLGIKDFLNDIGCKLVFYFHRVGRNVSVDTTCLLSVFRVITISPRTSRWEELKVKVPKNMGTFNILCWTLNMMLNIMVPVYVTGKLSNKNITKKTNYGYCYALSHGKFTESLYISLVLFHDIFSFGLMVSASSFMVFILHRHKQRVQHIHRTSISSKTSPESRATQSILVLVSTFVSLCTLSTVIHIFLSLSNNPSLWLLNTTSLIAGCFPTVSPYILMSHDSRVSRHCFAQIRNTKSSKLIVNM